MSTQKNAGTELPGQVIYHNARTGHDSREIGRLFECIPIAELSKLKVGETIWIDYEGPNGKVYGFDRVEIISIADSSRSIGFGIKGPYVEGGAYVEKKEGWHKVHRCTDTAKLLELMKQSPLTTEAGGPGEISEESQKYLEKKGYTIGFA